MTSAKPDIWTVPGFTIVSFLYAKSGVSLNVLELVRREVPNKVVNSSPTFSHFGSDDQNEFR